MLSTLTPDPAQNQTTPAERVAQILAAGRDHGRLRAHRVCAPADAPHVRTLCVRDRTVLPRWHQDDRGPSAQHRGVHVTAPDGAYSNVIAWPNRDHWLTYTVPVVLALRADILREHGVSPDLMRLWARIKSGYADPTTGRRCIVRPDTLASVMECHERTVQRCNRAARAIGLEIVILEGRMLDVDECTGARRRGSRQRGLSTEVALTTPRTLIAAVCSATPTRGRRLDTKTHAETYSPHKGQKDAASPRTTQKAAWARTRRLAAALSATLPWLAGESARRLSPTLARFTAADWTLDDLTTALHLRACRLGYGDPNPERIRTRPAALLAHMLRDLDPHADRPGENNPLIAGHEPLPRHNPDCDHGWITTTHHGHVVARPCPTCPPHVRRATPEDPSNRLPEEWEPMAFDGDPLF